MTGGRENVLRVPFLFLLSGLRAPNGTYPLGSGHTTHMCHMKTHSFKIHHHRNSLGTWAPKLVSRKER